MDALRDPDTRDHTDPAEVIAPDANSVTVLLLSVEQVAALLNCSPRHVYRLSDAGAMPQAVRLGSLVRWPRSTIESWIEDGCPRRMDKTCR